MVATDNEQVDNAQLNSPELATDFIEDVQSGTIVVGKLVRLAVERHLKDLERSKDAKYPFYFDPEAGARGIEWFNFLTHFEAEWDKHPFELDPWQAFIQWCAYGWKRKEDGYRRYKIIYIEVARKQGKSHIGAANGLYLLVADNEASAQIYSAATKREQAQLVHKQAMAFRESSPWLKEIVRMTRNSLFIPETNSKFLTRGKDSKTEDGLSVSGCVIDEYHAHPDNSLFNVLNSSTGARRQPLFFVITTAGNEDESPCKILHDHAVNVLEGKDNYEDNSLFAFIASLDQGDDPFDEKVFPKSNPALCRADNRTLLKDLREQAHTAKLLVSERNEYLQKRMNVWVQSSVAWLDVNKWDKLARPFNPKEWESAEVYAGFDLATTLDFTAFGLMFNKNERYYWKPEFWIPADTATKRAKQDHLVALTDWINEGHVNTTPGNTTDYDLVERRVIDLCRQYRVRELAYDERFAPQIAQHLQDRHGIKMFRFPQGYAGFNAPCRKLEGLINSGQINHDGNKVMRWMVGNVAVKTSTLTNEVRPIKPSDKSSKKIDGVTALTMALGRIITKPETWIGAIVI